MLFPIMFPWYFRIQDEKLNELMKLVENWNWVKQLIESGRNKS